MTIDFIRRIENAKVSAIEIIPVDATTVPGQVTGCPGHRLAERHRTGLDGIQRHRADRLQRLPGHPLQDKHGVTDDVHLFNEKLHEWEDYYNYHRPHGALDGQTPYERLLSKTRAQVSPTS